LIALAQRAGKSFADVTGGAEEENHAKSCRLLERRELIWGEAITGGIWSLSINRWGSNVLRLVSDTAAVRGKAGSWFQCLCAAEGSSP
jgi:hypothetical protein